MTHSGFLKGHQENYRGRTLVVSGWECIGPDIENGWFAYGAAMGGGSLCGYKYRAGDEQSAIVVLDQCLVGTFEDLDRAESGLRQIVYHGSGHGHEQRRRYAFAADVGDDECEQFLEIGRAPRRERV